MIDALLNTVYYYLKDMRVNRGFKRLQRRNVVA